MAGHRFYAPPESFTSGHVTLSEEESHHGLHALRLRVGDAVRIFDGCGREFEATVAETERRTLRLAVGSEVDAPCESPLDVTLAPALLKGERFEWILQKATELGVRRLVPLVTERTEPSALRQGAPGRHARWERIVTDATKQCGRRTFMELRSPQPFAQALAEFHDAFKVFFAERDAGRWASLAQNPRPARVVALIGPEGGWSAAERAQAQAAGCAEVTLGGRILRAETGAVLAAGLLQALWGDLA